MTTHKENVDKLLTININLWQSFFATKYKTILHQKSWCLCCEL